MSLPKLPEIPDETPPESVYDLFPELIENDEEYMEEEYNPIGEFVPPPMPGHDQDYHTEESPEHEVDTQTSFPTDQEYNIQENFNHDLQNLDNSTNTEGSDWSWADDLLGKPDQSKDEAAYSQESFPEYQEPSHAVPDGPVEDSVNELLALLDTEEEDEDEWTWEEIDDDDGVEGFIDESTPAFDETVPTYDPIEFEEPFQDSYTQTSGHPDSTVTTEQEPLKNSPKEEGSSKEAKPEKEKTGLWQRIKSDFGSEQDLPENKESNEEERYSSKKEKKPKTNIKILKVLATPYTFVAKIILRVLTSTLNIFSKIPIIGPLIGRVLKASKLLNVISLVIPIAIIGFGFLGITSSSVPSSTHVELPDEGSAIFKNFKTEGENKIVGVIENDGDVIANVDAVFKVYSYQPSLTKIGSWFSLKEVAECDAGLYTVDIDGSVSVEADCPNFSKGFFTRVSGVLIE